MECRYVLKALVHLSLWCALLKGFGVLAEVDQRGRSQLRAKEGLPPSTSLSAGLSGARRLASVLQPVNSHQAVQKGDSLHSVVSSTEESVVEGANAAPLSLVSKHAAVQQAKHLGTPTLVNTRPENTKQHPVDASAPAWPRGHLSLAVDSATPLLQQPAQPVTGGRFSAAHGGYSATTQQTSPCNQGQVSQIKCWLDAEGYITGLALEDEAGITAPALCRTEADQQTDGGALDEGESILEVISCKGPGGAITYMEFYTNGTNNQPITCGRASRNKSGTNSAYGGSPVEECESLSQAQLPGEDKSQQTSLRTGSDGYYPEVYPVMGLRAGCNAQQQLINISNRCWPVRDPTTVQASADLMS